MPTEVAVDFALRAIEAEAGFEVPWWLWLRTQALAYGYSPPVDDQFVVETDAFAALLADPQRQVPDGPRTATIVRGVARAALRLQASLGDRSGQVLAAQPTPAPSNQRIIDEPMRRRLSDCASAARGALFLDPGAYREPCSHLVSDADCAAALVSGQDVLAECVRDYCDRPQHLWPEACGNLEYLASRVGEFHVAHVELAYLILEREESGLFPPRWAWQPLWSVSRAVGSGLPQERQVQIAELAATLRTELGGEVDGGDEVLVSAFALADLLSQ
jgi:hypothetical protein